MTFPVFIENDHHYQYLKDELKFSDSEIIKTYPEQKPFFIFQEDGLHFSKDSAENKLLHVDFLKGSLGWRLKRNDHETLLKKALGKKNKNLTIFDGTAGFLSDTLIFLALGHKVIACEQSKVLFLLLSDAINRAKIKLNFLDNLNLIHGDALDIYKKTNNIDVIYLDPMYPLKKKNALRSGSISDIKSILMLENIANFEDQVFFDFKKNKFKKIVLKRPIKSKIIDDSLNYQIKGKSTRFDVYI